MAEEQNQASLAQTSAVRQELSREAEKCSTMQLEVEGLKRSLDEIRQGKDRGDQAIQQKNQEILDLREEIREIQNKSVQELGKRLKEEIAFMQ
jgi:uncharacterized protein YoxC